MAKRRRKNRKSKSPKRGGSQRAKFKKAAATCRARVGDSGARAFSPASWKAFGSCMKKEL